MTAITITRGLGFRVLLLASVCLNVFLGAFLATHWLETRRWPVAAAAGPRVVDIAAERLPTADAETLRSVYRSKEAAFTASQREYWQAVLAAGRLLAQPQLDAVALRTALEDARAKRLKLGDLTLEVFLEALPQMSPDGRRALIAGMRRR